MIRVFVDTSALLALLVPTDRAHQDAKHLFERLQIQAAFLVTTSYVLLETYALLGRRQGTSAVRSFREKFAPLLEVVWVGPTLHEKGLDILLNGSASDLSLVDAVSFVTVREQGIPAVFAFDRHFSSEGFLPPE